MGKPTSTTPSNPEENQELFGDGGPEKPVGFHDKPMSIWQRLPHRSDTGGVSPMVLEGREKYMNERMRGMTPEQRAYRKQWLQDQILTDREPVEVPQIYYELNNIFKRTFNLPFNKIEVFLKPKIGSEWANAARLFTKFTFITIGLVYTWTYMGLFYNADWSHFSGGVKIQLQKPQILPGDKDYPFTSKAQWDDYASYGFKDSVFFKSEEEIRAAETLKK